MNSKDDWRERIGARLYRQLLKGFPTEKQGEIAQERLIQQNKAFSNKTKGR